MKNENISTNNNSNKNILNSLITYNSYSTTDFQKINSSNNIINTSGSQPVVIFKKISKSLTQTFPSHKSNQPLNNNYASDGGLKRKIGKYKSFSSNRNQANQTSGNIFKSNKILKAPKTMRNINKKLLVKKKENFDKKSKVLISGNDEGKKDKNRIVKKNINKKNKENIKIEYHDKQSHSQGHFNRKNKIFKNNFVSESVNGINFNNNNKDDNKKNNNKKKEINNNIKKKDINNNIKKKNADKIKIKPEENKNKEIEEEKLNEQKLRKIKCVDSLIKNGVLNITKELNYMKKLTTKEILNKRKKDFLQENGFNEIIKDNNNEIKHQSQLDLNNINIKSIRKKNISTKNSNNIKNKTNNKLNISKSNSRFISFLNNNTNININMTNTNLITNNLDTQISNKNFKRIALKPQINQFEFLNKIQQEQKKLPRHKKQCTSRGIEKHLRISDYEPNLSDSFRHSNSNSKINISINLPTNHNNMKNEINLQRNSVDVFKKQKRSNLEEMDEFPFSHKKSHRTQQEIYNYLKEKRIETKKEEENTEKEKKLKAYMTFQNLMNIGKKFDINNNINNVTKISARFIPAKNKKEIKGHMKLRKEPNEYYVGTESSKNSSTFIDKNEYYISILESQKFVNKSKIGKTDEDKSKINDNDKDNIKEPEKEEKNKNKKKK